MANWHLEELRTALEHRGWRLTAELPGDDRGISGSWALRRSAEADVVLDFEGLDESRVLPMSESYACRIRGTTHSLYFRRRGDNDPRARERWKRELSEFVAGVGEAHAA